MELLLNGTVELNANDMEKAKVFSALFTLIFTSKHIFQDSQPLENRTKVWNREALLMLEFRESLNILYINKFTWCDRLQLKYLADVIARLLSIVFNLLC